MAKARRAAHWIAGELLDTWELVLGDCSEYTALSNDEQGHVRLLLARWADRHMIGSVEPLE